MGAKAPDRGDGSCPSTPGLARAQLAFGASPGPSLATDLSAWGLVVALEANFCRVALEAPGPGGVDQLLCVRRTRLGKTGQQICVGDRVQVEGVDWISRRGAVAAVAPRSSLLARPAVANCNRVVVVMALVQPDLDPIQLTRFLLTAEATGVQVDLVLTKADLLAPERLEEWRQRLATWGYDPWLVSAQTGVGIEPLRQHLAAPGIAVLCGPSGVGKSSLLNALVPDLALRVGAVSGRLQRGRHTTRHVELFAIGAGGLLADRRIQGPWWGYSPRCGGAWARAVAASPIACTRAIPAASLAATGPAIPIICSAYSRCWPRRRPPNPGPPNRDSSSAVAARSPASIRACASCPASASARGMGPRVRTPPPIWGQRRRRIGTWIRGPLVRVPAAP